MIAVGASNKGAQIFKNIFARYTIASLYDARNPVIPTFYSRHDSIKKDMRA